MSEHHDSASAEALPPSDMERAHAILDEIDPEQPGEYRMLKDRVRTLVDELRVARRRVAYLERWAASTVSPAPSIPAEAVAAARRTLHRIAALRADFAVFTSTQSDMKKMAEALLAAAGESA